MISEFY